MTYEEAKEEVIATICELDWEDRKYVSEHLSREALIACINALEKQIAKKVEWLRGDKAHSLPNCAMCGGIIDIMQGDANFCPNCGQALDWSEE